MRKIREEIAPKKSNTYEKS